MQSSWRVQLAMAHMHRRAGPGRAWLGAGLVPEWVALAAKAGRRFQKPPKAPRSATPAMPHRPLPISARCGSPSLYWPGRVPVCGMGRVCITATELDPKPWLGTTGCWENLALSPRCHKGRLPGSSSAPMAEI